MSQGSDPRIVDTLKAFFSRMHEWELASKQRYRRAKSGEISHAQANADSTSELRAIFTQFCASGEEPQRARGGTLHFSKEYDVEGEQVLSVEEVGGRATVVTQQMTTGFNEKCLYTLLKQRDAWKIVDDKKRFRPSGELAPYDL